jgi:hypothetical protein
MSRRYRNVPVMVIGVLGLVVGFGTFSVMQVADRSTAPKCAFEYRTVQAAIDAYMAQNNLYSVPGTDAGATSDMTKPLPLYVPNPTAANPNFVRNSSTQWAYRWDSSGWITQIAQAPGGPAVPAGCAVAAR